MIAIATATHRGAAVPPDVLDSIYNASRKDPLAAEPFLVRGVQAQLAGDAMTAREAFTAAKQRNPRSLAARYFLADDDFRRGDSARGLREIMVLARLAPMGAAKMAPYLASYALDRSNWPQLRSLFRADPALASETFTALARNPAHAGVILSLADEKQRDPRNLWVKNLIGGLIEAGRYQEARNFWADVSHVRLGRDALLFDAGFGERDPPPPFNWTLTSSSAGLAERDPKGGLHVIYYGQEDGVLAYQLLLLSPGNYRLTMRMSAMTSNVDPLRWRLTCAGSKAEIGVAPFSAVAGKGWAFTVPPSCEGQQLELVGVSSDMPRQVDLTVNRVGLVRERGNG